MTLPLDPALRGGEARLWRLIEERMQPGADTAAIDARIWDLFGSRWSVVATDLSGFSRRVREFGIIHFLEIIHEHKRLVLPIVERHDGVLVKAEADSLLLLFKRPERALECAVAMQHACQQLSARRLPEEKVLLCVGVGFGDVLRIGDTDVYGAEVNAASKLGEDLARADEILVTKAVRDAVGDPPGFAFTALDTPVPGCDDGAFRVRYPSAK